MTSSADAFKTALLAFQEFERTSDEDALDKATRYSEKSISGSSPGSPFFLEALRLHCVALYRTLRLSPRADLIEKLLQRLYLLLDIEQEPKLRLNAAFVLANSLEFFWREHDLTKTKGSDEEWDRAIELLDETIVGTPTTSEIWLRCAVKTGSLHLMRYQESGGPGRLERALEVLERALKAHDTPDAELLRNLSAVYLDRYILIHAPSDIRKSVDLGRRAAELAPDLPPMERGLLTLGHALQQQSDLEFGHWPLDESVRCFEEILEGPPIPLATHLLVSVSLAQSLSKRGNVNANDDDINRGIELAQDALARCGPNDLNRNWMQDVLETALQLRETLKRDPDMAIRTIKDVEDMLEAAPRFSRDTIMAASHLAEMLANNDQYDRVLDVTITHLMPLVAEWPSVLLATGTRLGRRALQAKQWETAAELLSLALKARQHLIHVQPSPADLLSVLDETRDIPNLFCYALARAGRMEDAVLAIEEARSFVSSHLHLALSPDALRLRKKGHRGLYQRLAQTAHIWFSQLADSAARNTNWAKRDIMSAIVGSIFNSAAKSASADAGTDRELWNRAQTELQEVVAEVRKISGYQQFGRSLSLDQILEAAAQDILVYLVATQLGGLAVVVDGREKEINVIWLPDLKNDKIWSRLVTFLLAQDNWRKTGADNIFQGAIVEDANWLWDVAGKQLVENLAGRDRVFLLAGNGLQFFPMHALGRKVSETRSGESFLDHIAVHYVSSAASLRSARQVLAESGNDSVLAVCGASRRDLPSAPWEIGAVTAHFEKFRTLVERNARKATVLSELPRHDVWHLTCHGTADILDPLATKLELQDAPLLLAELLDLPATPHRLAVLSACETGLGPLQRPEGAMNAGEVLQLCGVAGSLSTLWLVDDFATMILVAKFYELWRSQALSPGEALRQTQRWMRDTSNEQKAADLQRSGRVESNALDQLRNIEYDLSEPLYWSAFRMNGI